MKKKFGCFLFLGLLIISCHSNTAEEVEEPETTTPATITGISTEPMTEYIDLNATSTFLQKAYVKASANGYIKIVNAKVGNMVSPKQNVFVLTTKEAQSIGNTINSLDTSFKFSGIITIKAGTAGYISEVNHQPGDYVQEGEQLATINDVNSFVFILNLPYELRPYILNKKTVELLLPDGKSISGNIAYVMPVVDSVSQTQNVVITVKQKNLPANLVVKVKIEKVVKQSAVSLPKQSVLSDETQANFWVMKIIDSNTAVKIPVTKGMETSDRVEIISPLFSSADIFLLNGNYGLPDTARIRIVQQ